MASKKELTQASKFLSYVLRHAPQDIGISLDANGWVEIQVLIDQANLHGQSLNHELVIEVVQTSEKKRFGISDDGLRIRANQGHSTKEVSMDLPVRVPPDMLYHGTATRFLDSIMREGLKPGERHHVHLTESQEIASEVGKRYGKLVILCVNAKAMHDAGHVFWLSENGVWLTSSVAPEFLHEIK